jgi:gamma-glutamyltranspeptidase/glutathione hydrolase
MDDQLPKFSAHTVTVPGAAAAWCDVIEKWGKLDLAKILQPAIEMASDGFPVQPKAADWWAGGIGQLLLSPNADEMLLNGNPPKAGEIMKMPNLAKTFELLAKYGKKGFYEGEVAQAIVDAVQAAGGLMTLEDLKSHTSTFDDPICVNYRGVDVYEMPPNGQGITALIALNILNNFDLSKLSPLSAEHTHILVEAMRLAFADTRALVGDPFHVKMPLEKLLSPEYGKLRSAQITSANACADITTGCPYASSDTVYLSVADRWGNACSFINSNYMGFGSGLIPKGCGFTLQNRGANFVLDPLHPNALMPNKRPYHTIIPGMALKGGELFACFGNMGGFMQPQGHVQLLVNLIDHKMDPQSALNTPRFCISGGVPTSHVFFEEGYADNTLHTLKSMGHNVVTDVLKGVARSEFGNGQIIMRDPKTGVLCGGSDTRTDGLAIAW